MLSMKNIISIDKWSLFNDELIKKGQTYFLKKLLKQKKRTFEALKVLLFLLQFTRL